MRFQKIDLLQKIKLQTGGNEKRKKEYYKPFSFSVFAGMRRVLLPRVSNMTREAAEIYEQAMSDLREVG
ncbi:MAG: hypothetical protein AYK19_14200 [Theionarchaea archaeon DG-70-1]|nr:MAG: hypothetical protein AYK19_14200 [Theionarchaea archaeon DG-70-1]